MRFVYVDHCTTSAACTYVGYKDSHALIFCTDGGEGKIKVSSKLNVYVF